MQNDLYGYNAEYSSSTVLTAKEMKLVIEGTGAGLDAEYLLQNVNIRYSRPVRILRELSSSKGYMIKSPPMGMLSCDRVIGKNSISKFLKSTIELSKSTGVSATLKRISGTGTANGETFGTSYTMTGCRPSGLSLAVGVGQNIVTENFTMQFASMDGV